MTKPRAAHPAVRAGATEGVLSRPSLRHMDTWMPPCPAHLLITDVQTKIPSVSPPRQPLPLLPSLRSMPRELTLTLPPRRAVTSLSPSLRRPALLLRNTWQ
jgi:hypothetical protein